MNNMENAEQMLLARGHRLTDARIAVLSVLLRAGNALSHPEIARELAQQGRYDRVTLYRVLDWLVQQGLAHTVASEDRVRRFQATHGDFHRHAHFQCLQCGKVYCLPETSPQIPASLPANFIVQSLDLNVRGICAHCAPESH